MIGGFGRVNLERLLVALKPDVVIIWNMRGQPDQIAAQMADLGLPAVMVDAAPFSHYPASFRFLGRLLHREARAEQLAQALEGATRRLEDELGADSAAERAEVYYADFADGLKSQCAGSFRGEIVELSGGTQHAGLRPARRHDRRASRSISKAAGPRSGRHHFPDGGDSALHPRRPGLERAASGAEERVFRRAGAAFFLGRAAAFAVQIARRALARPRFYPDALGLRFRPRKQAPFTRLFTDGAVG